MDLDGDGRVNEAEYILAKLVEMHAVDPAEVELARQSFNQMDSDHDHFLRVHQNGTVF